MNPRFGEAPDPRRRYIPRPGAYAVIRAGNGILATFQTTPYPEMQLPGGGIDPGESPVMALHREVYEETGFRVMNLRRLGMFHRYTFMPEYEIWAQKQCHVYLADLGRRVSAPTEPGHIAVFLGWDEAMQRLSIDGDRHFLRLARRLVRA